MELKKIVGPDILRVGPEEGCPRPTMRARRVRLPMECWIVCFATLISSFSNSPWMRLTPHKRLATASALIKVIVASGILGVRACDYRFRTGESPDDASVATGPV